MFEKLLAWLTLIGMAAGLGLIFGLAQMSMPDGLPLLVISRT